MNLKNMKKTGLLTLLIPLLSMTGCEFMPWYSPDSSTDHQNDVSHVVVTSNYAGIQNNMVEFFGIFEGDGGDIENFSARKKDYAKLMKVGEYYHQDQTTTLQDLVSVETVTDLIEDFIVPYAEKIQGMKTEPLAKSVRLYYDTYAKVPVSHLLFPFPRQYGKNLSEEYKIVKFGSFDKELRNAGLSRYSIEFDVEVKPEHFMDGDEVNEDKIADKWIEKAIPLIDQVNNKIVYSKKAASKEFAARENLLENNGALAIFQTFVHDVAVMKVIGEHKAFDAAANVRRVFYSSAIGNIEAKNKRLARLFEKNNADVLCLQETNPDLGEELSSRGYFSVDHDTHPDLRNGSRIFLSSRVWKKEKTKSIEVTEQHLEPWMQANRSRVDAWNQELETKKGKGAATKKINAYIINNSKEVSVVRTVDQKGNLYYIASAHADGSGFSAEAQITTVLNAIKEDAKGGDYKFILGHDANTSQNPKDVKKLRKADLEKYLDHLKRNKLNIVFDDAGDDFVTVNKTRTFLQTQPKKANIAAKNRSDFIVFRGLTGISRKKITQGPNVNENPTDHAILVGTLK